MQLAARESRERERAQGAEQRAYSQLNSNERGRGPRSYAQMHRRRLLTSLAPASSPNAIELLLRILVTREMLILINAFHS
jgi:hypothetical protein